MFERFTDRLTISLGGSPASVGRRGDAVVVDGTWEITRHTSCGLVAMAGVQCPDSAR